MKTKLIPLALAALFLSAFTSCTDTAESPSAITTRIVNAAQKGDFKPFLDSFDMSDEYKDIFKSLMYEKGEKYIADKKGIRSSEIVSEEFEGDDCNITVKLKYGNGSSETMLFSYHRKNGAWVQVFSK